MEMDHSFLLRLPVMQEVLVEWIEPICQSYSTVLENTHFKAIVKHSHIVVNVIWIDSPENRSVQNFDSCHNYYLMWSQSRLGPQVPAE